MKIVVIALSVRGAMGQYLSALIESLSKKASIELFVPSHFPSVDLGKNVTINRIKTGNTKSSTLISLINPVRSIKLFNLVRTKNPDCVHIFNAEGYPWSVMTAVLARIRKIPLVLTIHDVTAHPGNFWDYLNHQFRRLTLLSANLIHCHSQRFSDELIKQGVLDKRIRVIPHGSLADEFLQFRNNKPRNGNYILFFGRLEYYKGIDILVSAAFHLEGKYKFIIAGPGDLPKNLERKISENKNLFEFHNRYLSNAEVSELFERSSVCVLPYRQVTQSSLPLIAAAYGVPVVGSALGAFLDDIPRVNGILVKPNSVTELVRGILEAENQVPTYPAELQFTKLADDFIELYSEAISK